MPTVQGTDDFNHAINAGYYVDGFFGAPTGVGTPLYPGTPQSLSIVTDGGNVGVRHNITGTPVRGWMGFPFRVPSMPVAQTFHICNFATTSGGSQGNLYLGSDGVYADVSGVSGSPHFSISANTWYWLECIFDVSGGTHTLYFRVNGSDGVSAGFGATATTITWGQFVALSDPAGFTQYYGGMWKWGSASSTSDWLGVPSLGQTILPDADVAAGGWTTSPLFSKLNDSSDATFITATAA